MKSRNMCLFFFPLWAFLLSLNLQPSNTHPISSVLTDTDLDLLQVLIQRLKESVSEQTAVDEGLSKYNLNALNMEDSSSEERPPIEPDEAEIRELLSAKNLKSLRNDSSRRSSGCFGRRMDRIGSMSSLGCNTIGRYNPKKK